MLRKLNKRVVELVLIVFCSLVTSEGLAHAFHGFPGVGQHDGAKRLYTPRVTMGERFPGVVKLDSDGTIKYAFSLPEKDLVKNLPKMDKNNDKWINPTEFRAGFVGLDKWIRAHVEMSSKAPGFIRWMLGGRDNCKTKKIEYSYRSQFMNENFYAAMMTFECPSTKEVEILNGLSRLFREFTQGMALNVVLVKKDGPQALLKASEPGEEIVVGDL